MPLLHDQAVRSRIESRLRALTPDRRPLWGKMSVDQMLWHLNEALAGALGEMRPGAAGEEAADSRLVDEVPRHQPAVGQGGSDDASVRGESGSTISKPSGPGASGCCRHSCDKPIDSEWPLNPLFGAVTGRDVSRLHAKHFDHHLRQFGV